MPAANIVEAGVYDGAVTEFILSALPTPPAAYLAFEPDPRNVARIRDRGIAPGVTLVQAAVTDRNGTGQMWLSSTAGGVTGSNTLRDPAGHRSLFDDIRHDEQAEVKLRRLDDVCAECGINRIDFLFTDIEGSERDLAAGAVNMLPRTRYWYTEFWEGRLPYAGMWEKQDFLLHLPGWRIEKCFEYDMLLFNAAYRG